MQVFRINYNINIFATIFFRQVCVISQDKIFNFLFSKVSTHSEKTLLQISFHILTYFILFLTIISIFLTISSPSSFLRQHLIFIKTGLNTLIHILLFPRFFSFRHPTVRAHMNCTCLLLSQRYFHLIFWIKKLS